MTPHNPKSGEIGSTHSIFLSAFSTSCRSRNGFTLVELIVVFCIIAFLVSLTLVAVKMLRESAYRTTCANNLRQLGISALAYRIDNRNEWMPGYPGYWPADLVCATPLTLEAQYGLPLKAWICPAEGAWLGRKTSLWYETASNNPTIGGSASLGWLHRSHGGKLCVSRSIGVFISL